MTDKPAPVEQVTAIENYLTYCDEYHVPTDDMIAHLRSLVAFDRQLDAARVAELEAGLRSLSETADSVASEVNTSIMDDAIAAARALLGDTK